MEPDESHKKDAHTNSETDTGDKGQKPRSRIQNWVATFMIVGASATAAIGLAGYYHAERSLVLAVFISAIAFLLAVHFQWQHWNVKRLCILLGILTFIACATWYFNVPSVPSVPNETIVMSPIHPRPPPAFQLKSDNVMIRFGNNTFQYEKSQLENTPFEPLEVNGYKPLALYLEKNMIYVNAKLYLPETSEPFIIIHNDFKEPPPGMDINYNASAIELVNDNKLVVFQMVYQTPTDIRINGIFFAGGGLIFVDEHGIREPFEPYTRPYSVKPIFKYPAWQYPGQYADETKH
jgi:hypothetical protein